MVKTIFPDDTARVRRSDPLVSHEAADSNDVPYSHMVVLTFLKMYGPLAQHETWDLAGNGRISPSRVRSAFSELEALGKVKRTDQFRLTPSGRRAQVWSLA